MWETLATIGISILIIVGPAVLILWRRDKIHGRIRRESPEQRDLRLEAWRQRMLHPEIEAVEEFCGGKIPARLIAMYSDHDLTFKCNFEVSPPDKAPKRQPARQVRTRRPLRAA